MLQNSEWEKKTEMKKQLRQILESAPWLTVDTQWRVAKETLAPVPCFAELDALDSLKVFEEYMRELEVKDIENDRKERDQIKRASRKAREQFKALLDYLLKEEKFTTKTSWQSVLELVKEHPAYQGILNAEGYVIYYF